MQDIIKVMIPIGIAHVVVLGVIIFIIRKMLLSETLKAVEKIRQVEAEVRKKEESIRREIDEHEKEFERKKVEAEDDLTKRQAAMEKELAHSRELIVAEAKKEADRIVDQAKKNEEKFRQQLAQEMEEKSIDYGSQIFRLVFSEKMTEAIDRQFIGELLDALQEIDASGITVDGTTADFTAGRPLAADQKQRLEQLLAEKFGVKITVQEKVQEDLMAGLVFKLGSLEIDGSLRNRFLEAAGEVKKNAGR